ncbi:hypothetical protein AAFO92_20965 [Roseovarius sp. CAU 1744]|uniref:COG4223 family protein n=1 Tax=Roseovarius sp. CAU 1744 TaxID=3140368 RepID=UPI00325B31DF
MVDHADNPDEGDAGTDAAESDQAVAAEDDAAAEPELEQADNSTPAAEPVIIRQGGFVPMVLGGLVAAAIGFGLARFVLPETGADPAVVVDIQRKVEGQTGAVTKLSERVETLELGSDLSALEAARDDVQATIAGLADRLAGLESELAEIRNLPRGDGASGAALAAYEQELSDLRTTVEAMTERSAVLEENARAAAQATLQRAALTRIMTALDAGVAFESAVADLAGLGVAVPEVLQQAAATGVPSLTALQESFPDAARAALAASRDAGAEAESGGLTSFLRSQLGARSLVPREGNDPDAVLSRVEAAAREGRMSDALAEIEALPEEGRAELAEWVSQVQSRQEAVSAAHELSAALN